MKIETRTLEAEIARQALTYKKVAAAAHITEKTLKQARSGAEIQPATAGRIAEALGVNVEKIIK